MPPIAHLSPLDAVIRFARSEVYEVPAHLIAKSTLHAHYLAWTLEAPGRPPLSANAFSRLMHKVCPNASTVLSPVFVSLDGKPQRPSCWWGLRMVYPPADDPYEERIAVAAAKEAGELDEPFTEEELAYRKAHGLD
jgi:hypothetical protein